jgi:mono/diheme cytochrome c family protein
VGAALALVAALPAWGEDGAALFAKHCAGCHKADASGVPGFGPSLRDGLAPVLARPDGADYVLRVVLNGLKGPIESAGRRYNGVMPAFAAQPDATIEALLAYLLDTLHGQPAPDGAAIAAARTAPLTPDQVHALRARVLAGAS